jgi:hypothetical protein
MESKNIKLKPALWISLLLLCGCKNVPRDNLSLQGSDHLALANQFVDAFYSFNRDSLASILSFAKESHPNILYYQKWAECGHYEVLKRDTYSEKNDSVVIFPVTVKDDLMAALKIDFNVTDTFHIVFEDGNIRRVENSSNDPDAYYQAKDWVKQNHPELVDKACEGVWAGGPTPCDCIQGFVKGFKLLKETESNSK